MQNLSPHDHSTMVAFLKVIFGYQACKGGKDTVVHFWQCFPTPCSVTLCLQSDIGRGSIYTHGNWQTLQYKAKYNIKLNIKKGFTL